MSHTSIAGGNNIPENLKNLRLDFPKNVTGIGVIPGTGITQWQRPYRSYDLFAPLVGRRSNTNMEYQLAMIVFGNDLATHIFRGKPYTGYYKNMFGNLKQATNALLKFGVDANIGDEIIWYNLSTKHYGGLRVDDINKSQSGLPCKKFSIVLYLRNKIIRDTSVACYVNNRWFYNYTN